jgi:signal transduction histidine kinase
MLSSEVDRRTSPDFGHDADRADLRHCVLIAALDATSSAVVIADQDGCILLANSKWRAIDPTEESPDSTNSAPGNYLESGFVKMMNSLDGALVRESLRRLLRGQSAEFRHLVHVRGIDRWYHIHGTRAQSGRNVRVILSHDDAKTDESAERTIKELSRRLLDLQEKERQRIAIELHDSTAQQLAAASLYLMSLRQSSAQNDENQNAFDEIERLLDQVHKEVRTFSYLLHPTSLQSDGLRFTLNRFVEGFGRRAGLTVAIRISSEVDTLRPDLQLALLRIVQEALTNVHRHACATRVRVKLRVGNGALLLAVADDGVGQPEANRDSIPWSPGLGLQGMRARLQRFGGILRVVSNRRGTTVLGRVALSQRRARGL